MFMQIRATIIVHGKVQGVGFRAAAKAIAQEMGIKGYVQNLPDGTVRIVAEAEEEAIKKLVKILKSREILGNKIVTKADVSYEDATDEFTVFEIRR
jgi:acylphosphatase